MIHPGAPTAHLDQLPVDPAQTNLESLHPDAYLTTPGSARTPAEESGLANPALRGRWPRPRKKPMTLPLPEVRPWI